MSAYQEIYNTVQCLPATLVAIIYDYYFIPTSGAIFNLVFQSSMNKYLIDKPKQTWFSKIVFGL